MGGRDGISRRGLFGAGLSRALEARLDPAERTAPRSHPAATAGFAGWGENAAAGLGGRLEPVAEELLTRCGVGAGSRVVVATAGDGPLAIAAARRGARVTAIEASAEDADRGRGACVREGVSVAWHEAAPTRLPVEDGRADAVVSLFGVSHAHDPRAVKDELIRAAAPGAPIALTAWTGVMAAVLRAAGGPARRSQRWARFETAYLHFFDFPDLDVVAGQTEWRFGDVAEATEALAAPAGDGAAAARVREILPALLAEHASAGPDGLRLTVSYATVFARRP